MKRFRTAALMFAMVFPTLLTWVYFSLLRESPALIQQTAYGTLKTLQFLFPIAWFLWDRNCFEARSDPADAEIDSDLAAGTESGKAGKKISRKSGIALGLVFGLAVSVAIFAFYFLGIVNWPEGELLKAAAVEKVSALNFTTPLMYLGLGVFYALIHSFLEEYYWRWFVFRMIETRSRFWPAAIISSLGFMAHHVILLTHFFGWQSWLAWVCSAGVAVGGLVWCWLYRKSNGLLAPWLSHLVVDAAIFGVGYFVVQELFV